MCQHSSEEWRDVPGYEGSYQASSLGRIRSLERTVWNGSGFYRLKGRIMKPNTLPKGYKFVVLRKDKKSKNHYVHVLVLWAFVGPCPEGMETRHFPDRDPANNAIANLQWDTPTNNNADKVIHGTTGKGRKSSVCGEQHVLAVLTAKDVQEIRQRWLQKRFCIAKVARQYGVSWGTLKAVVVGETWKHVEVSA